MSKASVFADYFWKALKKKIILTHNKESQNLAAKEYTEYVIESMDSIKTTLEGIISAENLEYLTKNLIPSLVQNRVFEILNSTRALPKAIRQKDFEMVSKYLHVCSILPGNRQLIANSIENFIGTSIKKLAQNKEINTDPRVFIPEAFQLVNNLKRILDFFEGTDFKVTLGNYTIKCFNREKIYGVLLAAYCNFFMRSGAKGLGQAEVRRTFDSVEKLLEFITNKLAFVREYSRHLSDRLAKRKFLSIGYENDLANRIKAAISADVCSNITSMLADVKRSTNLMAKFRCTTGIETRVTVIQSACWSIPEYDFTSFEIPVEIQECLGQFTEFYKRLVTNVLLQPCYLRGEVEVLSHKFKRKHIITFNLVQFSILSLLKEKEALTLKELCTLLSLKERVVIDAIFFLMYGPFNSKRTKQGSMLITTGKQGAEPVMEDKFSINYGFTAPSVRVSCLPVSLKSRKSKNDEEKEKRLDRQNLLKYMSDVIDSNIVRIMKGRKDYETEHSVLVNEVVMAIDIFKCNPTHIKERIESLINRKLLRRAGEKNNMYEYIS